MSADGQSYHGFIIYRADVTGGLGSDSRAVCPKRLAMLTGWKWFVMDGIPAICSEHVPGSSYNEAIEGDFHSGETAVSMGFTRHVQPSRCVARSGGRQTGIAVWHHQSVRPGEQGVPAGREWLESARQPVEPISGSETRGRASL